MIRIRFFKTAAFILGALIGLTPVASVSALSPTNDTGYYRGAGPEGKPNSGKVNSSLKAQSQATAPSFSADCPPTITCIVEPAAFAANDGNIEDYGNYDTANRPTDMAINSIIIHDTEGNLQEVLDHFKNSRAYAATQYVVAEDGTVYQMVQNKDLPWHSGNWYYNMHSIGIEHVGHAAAGGYPDAMYKASAELTKYLIKKYNMLCSNLNCIIGHDNVPAVKASQIAGMHNDPGPYWNWQRYRALVGEFTLNQAPTFSTKSNFGINGVTVAPVWPLNKQIVTGCSNGSTPPSCAPSGLQPTNFVYLRTEPKSDAPLFTDPFLGQGTTDINNNAARLFYGQTFALSDYKFDKGGVWLKVAVNGAYGWFYSSWSAPTAFPALGGKYASPKAGKPSASVYGRPSPETAAYPASLLGTPPASFWIPTLAPTAALPYQMSGGQQYRVISEQVPNDHFYAWSLTADRTLFPYDHTVFKGTERFVLVQLGNRQAYVKASDVDIR